MTQNGANGIHGDPALFDATDEHIIVGTFLSRPEETAAIIGCALDPTLFFSESCRTILFTALELRNKGQPVDHMTVTHALRQRGKLDGIELLDTVGGAAAVTELSVLHQTNPAALPRHLENVQRRAAKRAFRRANLELADAAEDDSTPLEWLLDQMNSRREAIAETLVVKSGLRATSLWDLESPDGDDSNELLRHRFLSVGGGALLVGPTGIGKSALAIQCAAAWAVGRPCFGIQPARPLRSLIIQAENDDGDLAEMRDGAVAGLRLPQNEQEQARVAVFVHQEKEQTGPAFFSRTVEPLLREHRPQILWIDPALSYLGGDASAQKDVGPFLRNGLNPLLGIYGCAAIVLHHTAKPPRGEEKSGWSGNDLAYLGSGSAEWANWARAVIGIRGLGQHDVFELVLGKRGARVGWKDADGNKLFAKLIAHSKEPGRIYWREAEEDERPASKIGAPKKFTFDTMLSALDEGDLLTSEWLKAAQQEHGIGRTAFFDLKREMERAGAVFNQKSTSDGA